ncbi:hypothetical protein AB0896_33020 [Streptomyces parvulus]
MALESRPLLSTVWSSYSAASAGAVSANAVRRCIDTQGEQPWEKQKEDGS